MYDPIFDRKSNTVKSEFKQIPTYFNTLRSRRTSIGVYTDEAYETYIPYNNCETTTSNLNNVTNSFSLIINANNVIYNKLDMKWDPCYRTQLKPSSKNFPGRTWTRHAPLQLAEIWCRKVAIVGQWRGCWLLGGSSFFPRFFSKSSTTTDITPHCNLTYPLPFTFACGRPNSPLHCMMMNRWYVYENDRFFDYSHILHFYLFASSLFLLFTHSSHNLLSWIGSSCLSIFFFCFAMRRFDGPTSIWLWTWYKDLLPLVWELNGISFRPPNNVLLTFTYLYIFFITLVVIFKKFVFVLLFFVFYFLKKNKYIIRKIW